MVFGLMKRWKSPSITRSADFPNQNLPIDSAEEAKKHSEPTHLKGARYSLSMISSWVESGANPLWHVFIEVLGIFFGIARRSAARCSAPDHVAPHEALSRAMVPNRLTRTGFDQDAASIKRWMRSKRDC